ncbi:hypothetical protein WJX72_000251 [[Myrmecia] bisecta]|uniref:Intraflagellar transport protein 122 homolog n=1 Tax=[Myrmecia] bisecta TaxID=41462 RepID=A0AAW1PNU0_9CHLO
MRTHLVWSDTPPEKDGIKSVCYDLAFKPDGTQLVAGVGGRVLVYDTVEGELLHSLRGHKDAVYCVAYSNDGKRFASGGADKTVIIWTHKAEGILKYTHNDAIQALAYNPVSHQLASATATDFGLWSPEQKSVTKHKVSAKVVSMAWTNDGQHVALGQYNGHISIRTKAGTEKVLIQRSAPVWSLSWNPASEEGSDVLVVGCWDSTLSFYQLSGQPIGKEKALEFDPCCISHFGPGGEYICLGGTDRKATLCTNTGVLLATVAQRESWVWAAKAHTKSNHVAIGCEDGSVSVYQLVFSTVHGLYQDRYAYRESMTDVIIQHLTTEQKVRIKCRDYVKKLAVYRDRLAVQLPDRVIIYELAPGTDEHDMHYRVATKINQKLECNLLVVTSRHVTLCQEKKLQLYNFEGVKEREWVMDSVIRYIKVVGGPAGRDGLLVGLKSGQIMKIYVDNQFPIPLIKHSASIRCLDLSASRNKMAVVDDNNSVHIYSLLTKALVWEEANANSVAWNSEYEDMLCFSGAGLLSTKTGNFPLHQQKLQGFVVGFKGSKIFCLHYISMQTLDVPQSASMHRYLEMPDFERAYKVACLGVTEADWRDLANAALRALDLNTARKAFIRVRDTRYIELLSRLEQQRKGAAASDSLFLADILAYQGHFKEAAKMYASSNALQRALDMFTDLRQFGEATAFAEQQARSAPSGGAPVAVQDYASKQAEWSEEVSDFSAAAEMYLQAKKYDKAIAIIGRQGWWDKLCAVTGRLDPAADAHALQLAASLFRQAGQTQFAKETLVKLGDFKALAELAVEGEKWDEARELVRAHPDLRTTVCLPHARWLLQAGRFDEACTAFREAGELGESARLLQQLVQNAIAEKRFADAAAYYYQLALQELGKVQSHPSQLTPGDAAALEAFQAHYARAEIYYAYHLVHSAAAAPFHTVFPATLFSAARFLLMQLLQDEAKGMPAGVSLAHVVHCVAQQAQQQGAHKLARWAYAKLQTLRLPPAWQEPVDLASLLVRSQPFADAEDLQPICYRCGATNPLMNPQGDVCVNCAAPFTRSFLTFEHLPVVEFQLEHGITDAEAAELLDADDDSPGPSGRAAETERWNNGGADVLRLNEDEGLALDLDDPFTTQMLASSDPVAADWCMLKRLKRQEVLVHRWPNPHMPCEYFRVMDPDQPLCVGPCGHLYEEDEFEMAVLEKGFAPFCQTASTAAAAADFSQPASSNGLQQQGSVHKPGMRTTADWAGSAASSERPTRSTEDYKSSYSRIA